MTVQQYLKLSKTKLISSTHPEGNFQLFQQGQIRRIADSLDRQPHNKLLIAKFGLALITDISLQTLGWASVSFSSQKSVANQEQTVKTWPMFVNPINLSLAAFLIHNWVMLLKSKSLWAEHTLMLILFGMSAYPDKQTHTHTHKLRHLRHHLGFPVLP